MRDFCNDMYLQPLGNKHCDTRLRRSLDWVWKILTANVEQISHPDGKIGNIMSLTGAYAMIPWTVCTILKCKITYIKNLRSPLEEITSAVVLIRGRDFQYFCTNRFESRSD